MMLTPKEREILQYLADGKTCPEIGIILGRSYKTIETHLSNMQRKNDTHTIGQTIAEGFRSNILK